MTLAVNLAQGASNNVTFRNKIINGACVIDQRNAGASVTPTNTGSSTYLLDRWKADISQSSKFSVQQSSTAPAGFTNSLAVTSLSAYTVGSAEVFAITQIIEGFNNADFAWGTASAATVTLSFWVRSSLTGTFGIVLENSANNRSYPATYTISVANTFEYKTLTIAGDTSGIWLTNNGKGIQIKFGLGIGSSLSGTAGSWAAADYWGATGATSVVGTNGATFYITGVQLEAGTTASPFEYRQYGTELALCQRYCYVTTAAANFNGGADGTTSGTFTIYHPAPMRASPTATTTAVWKVDNYATVASTSSGASCSGVSVYQSQLSCTGFSPAFISKDNLKIIPGTNAGVATITAEL